VSAGLHDALRRMCTGSFELYMLLVKVLIAMEESRSTQGFDTAGLPAGRRKRRRRSPPRLPTVWIESLLTARNTDGSVEIIVNGTRIVLKPHLGALFLALAEDTGVSDDEGVGFKTLGALSARMAKLTGGRILPDETINKYVHRLRQDLVDVAGLTSDVIQSRHRLGRRLAVRRSTLKQGEKDPR